MIIGQVGVTSLLVLYLYSERDWTAAHAALALGGVQVGAALARVSAGRWSDFAASGWSRFAGWPHWPACFCWRRWCSAPLR